jgi:acylphosphatase
MNREDLKALTVKQLKSKCKKLGLSGYSRLHEDELIELIVTNEVQNVETVEKDIKEKAQDTVTFKKLIKGAFGYNGKTFKGSTFELSLEDAECPRIKHAIKCKIIEVV